MLQHTRQWVATTSHSDISLCVCRSGYKLLQQVAQYVAVTNRFVCTWELLCKSWSLQHNIVAATSLTNSGRFDFVTYCSNKILLRSQISPQKFSSMHEAICRSNTCHLVCSGLNSTICPSLAIFCNAGCWSLNPQLLLLCIDLSL